MIQILKIMSTVGQTIMPLVSFEMMGFAAFILVLIQNALIGIDTRSSSDTQDTPKN